MAPGSGSSAVSPTPRSSRRFANTTFPVDEEIEIRASLLRSNSLGDEALESSLDQASESDASDNFSNRLQRSPRCPSRKKSVDSNQTVPSLGVAECNPTLKARQSHFQTLFTTLHNEISTRSINK